MSLERIKCAGTVMIEVPRCIDLVVVKLQSPSKSSVSSTPSARTTSQLRDHSERVAMSRLVAADPFCCVDWESEGIGAAERRTNVVIGVTDGIDGDRNVDAHPVL